MYILFLVVKTRDSIEKDIEVNCREIIEAKLKIKERNELSQEIKIELINMKDEEGIYLKELNIYIIKFLNYLFLQPKLTANILSWANMKDIKENLAPFIGNYFYENFLSPYYIQDNLLYVITILLQKEINNLIKSTDYTKFLEDSCAGFLLNELKNKNELKVYFRRIINKTVEKLEYDYFKIRLIFSIPFRVISDKKDELFADDDSVGQVIYGNKIILNKYFHNLQKDLIVQMRDKYKNENKEKNQEQNIYDEFLNIYSKKFENKKFFESLEITEDLKKSYLNIFCVVVDCINQLISDLLLNIDSFPYSLKCISKIISLLIQQKFPGINARERYAFVGKYIFCTIILPFLCEPAKELLMNEGLISENTIYNLSIISDIFKKLIFGELYTNAENNFTVFNLFFIDKIKDIENIYNTITEVKLPDFIENIIYNRESKDNAEFNYEQMNKDEIIVNKFICFQFDDILAIIDTIKNNQDSFYKINTNIGLAKTFEKLTSETSTELIENIKINTEVHLSLKNLNKDELNSIKKHYYFYIYEITINKAYEKYYKIEVEKPSISANFVGASDEEKTKANISKVKDCICSILENYQTLSEKKFLEEKMNDTKSIFGEIKNSMYVNNYYIDNTIPYKWYLSSLFEYLEKLPENYKNNDYELIYDEIEKKQIDYIKSLNFDFLAAFQEKLNFSKKNLDGYLFIKNKFNALILNNKIKFFIANEIIPISLYFNYKEKIIEIKSHNINAKTEQSKKMAYTIKEKGTNRTLIICKTISTFTKAFPNLVKYESLQDDNILELIEKLDLPKKLMEYNEIIKLYLKRFFQETDNKTTEYILDKINNYIMSRTYDKIFPCTEEMDDKIYRQSVYLSWIEPSHCIPKEKIFNLEVIKSDFHDYLTKFQEKKSPLIKFKYLSKIFKLILESAKFNGHELKKVDDTMNYLIYLLIKEKPMKLYSNSKYLELFLFNKENKKEDNEIAIIISICEHICKMQYSNLINVTVEEYNRKCREAAENDLSQ